MKPLILIPFFASGLAVLATVALAQAPGTPQRSAPNGRPQNTGTVNLGNAPAQPVNTSAQNAAATNQANARQGQIAPTNAIQTINRAQPGVNIRGSAPVNSQAAAQPAAQPAPQPVTTVPTTTTSSPVDSLLNEDLIRSLRDPFQLPSILMTKKDTPKTDLEIYPLKDFKLNGVITGPKKTRAMVTTPNNKVFFVRLGDKMGVRDGTITGILPDSIKITEYYTDEHGKRTPDVFELTMSGELVSLNKKEE